MTAQSVKYLDTRIVNVPPSILRTRLVNILIQNHHLFHVENGNKITIKDILPFNDPDKIDALRKLRNFGIKTTEEFTFFCSNYIEILDDYYEEGNILENLSPDETLEDNIFENNSIDRGFTISCEINKRAIILLQKLERGVIVIPELKRFLLEITNSYKNPGAR